MTPRWHASCRMHHRLCEHDARQPAHVTCAPQAEDLHGDGPVAIASNGDIHASIGINGKLAIWQAKGVKEGQSLLPLCQVVLQLPPDIEAKAKKLDKNGRQKMLAEKPPKWMAFDCTGEHLGVHRPGVGMWMCTVHANGEVTHAQSARAALLSAS